uniref:Beta-defensin 130 n=1 Tax=Garrulax canorus TaxID=238855 RepID=A0A3G1AYB5_9PASS|nr:beta-defensin 130 [Garrulax canorus]
MKILFLLFSLILLLVQCAAGNDFTCKRQGGFCKFWRCKPPTREIGKCATIRWCCRR